MDVDEHAAPLPPGDDNPSNAQASSELWDAPLGQSTYLFIWALASLASFAIFFKYF
tara:strand:- start:70 stop:237 length:168 start_codon:yes stop_codon:yes gene_type:complete